MMTTMMTISSHRSKANRCLLVQRLLLGTHHLRVGQVEGQLVVLRHHEAHLVQNEVLRVPRAVHREDHLDVDPLVEQNLHQRLLQRKLLSAERLRLSLKKIQALKRRFVERE
jgi:hypothetical protein